MANSPAEHPNISPEHPEPEMLLLSSPQSAQVAGNPCPLALPKTAVAASFKTQFSFGLSAKSRQFTCRFHGDIAKEVSAPAQPWLELNVLHWRKDGFGRAVVVVRLLGKSFGGL